MRYNKSLIILVVFLTGITVSCKDDSLVIVPEWETGVHGFGTITDASDDVNFIKGDPSIELTMDLLWNSIDKQNTVTKIELFVLFNEAYVDQDGNPKTAKHGGDNGLLFMTMDAASVPDDKEPTTFTISQDDVFDLYEGAEFDYFGTGALPVWGTGQLRADRNTDDFKFVDGDSFQLRWAFTTDDGRVFSAWGISVCTEFPGANCSVNWQTVCSQIINEPAGDWVIDMKDSYGDGWQGGYVGVIIDGVEEYQVTIPDYWETGEGPYAALQEIVNVPPGTTSLSFEWNTDTYNGECSFTITSPKGNVIAKAGPAPAAGVLTLDLCKENE